MGNAGNASTSRLTLTLSATGRPTTAPSRIFAQNRGSNPVVAYDGSVVLPASVGAPVPAPWSTAHALRIAFTQPFRYTGGVLCIGIEGEPVDPPEGFLWWADYDYEGEPGTVQVLGAGCGQAMAANTTTAGASARDLRPGSTTRLWSVGWPNTAGALLLGAPLAQPVSLAGLGAPGCNAYVTAGVFLNTVYPAASSGIAWTVSYQDLDLPGSAALMGQTLAAQALNLEPTGQGSNAAGLTTTNGVALTVASQPVPGSMATVTSKVTGDGQPFPVSGRVSVSRAPVLQLETL